MRSRVVFNACEGAVLLVDASQGVEAQTIGQCLPRHRPPAWKSFRLSIKIDLPNAILMNARQQLEDRLGLPGKNRAPDFRQGTAPAFPELFEVIVDLVPPPKGSAAELQMPHFRLFYDTNRGVIPAHPAFFRQSQTRR